MFYSKTVILFYFNCCSLLDTGKGGKNRRRGKNENESDKRELVFKEDGQGKRKGCFNA